MVWSPNFIAINLILTQNIIAMKKNKFNAFAIGLCTVAGLVISNYASAQWSLSGNSVSAGDFIGTTNGQPLVFKSNNTEGMRLSTGGFLGIGIALPDQLLHVHQASTGGANIHFTSAATGNSASDGAYLGLNGLDEVRITNKENEDIVFSTNSLERMRIMKDGMVGIGAIGTGVPDAMLYLDIADDFSASSGLRITTPQTFQQGAGLTESYFQIDRGIGTHFIVDKDGLVGIGTATPSHQLHIHEGTSSGVNFHLTNSTTGSADTDGAYFSVNTSSQVVINNKENEDILFYANDDEKMRINSDGSVGIGTDLDSNTENYLLAVNGKVGAKEVQVETTSDAWPDYVFASDYQLQSLAEVEQFIHANKHLPGVPSAQEVGEEGINLGEMNAILLQKIEELTLHMIALEKKNEALEAKINQQ